jgi:phospholipid-binding lipoprotein MlaA
VEVKRLCAALIFAGSLAGCATSGGNPADPLERVNRATFAFNDATDSWVFTPLAKGFRFILPGFARTGISNFFSNLDDVWVSVNDVLQGKFQGGLEDITRVVFNTTFGIGGLFDFASPAGLSKHNEDFGQTLAVWGVESGPYVVIPFLGPSTFRDGFGLIFDYKADPVYWATDSVAVRNSLYATRALSNRAKLLDATSLLEQAALDRYSFVRDAWLQRRRNLVYDGDPPRERDESDDEPNNK